MPISRAKPLLLAFAVLVAFGLGVVLSARMAWFQPIATVTIQNRIGQQLRSLELQFEGAAARGVLRLPALADGASVDARIIVRGEGSYTVHAVLLDGTSLKLTQGYVETGYHVSEVIGPSRIEPAVGSTYSASGK